MALADKLKELGGHGLVYGLGSAIQSGLAFVLIPLYTRHFSVEVYGVFALCIVVSQLAGNVFSFGIANSLARSYYDYDNAQDRKKVVSTSIFLTTVGIVIQVSLGFIFKDNISSLIFGSQIYGVPIFCALVGTALGTMTNIGYVILRFEKKSKQVVYLNLISLFASVGLVYYFLVVMDHGLVGSLLGLALGQMLLLVIMIWLTKESFTLSISRRELKVQMAFGGPMMLTTVVYFLITANDRFLIEHYLTLREVGIYTLGFMLGSIINIALVMPFGMIWAPIRTEYRGSDDMDEFYRLVLTYYFMIGFAITVLFSLFGPELVSIVSGSEQYQGAGDIITLVMVSFLLLGAIRIIDNGIYFSRKTHYHAYVYSFCLLVNFSANYFLIPIFGYMVAAVNFFFTFFIALALIFWITNKIEYVQLERDRLLKIFISSLLTLALSAEINSLIFEYDFTPLLYKTLLMSALVIFFYAGILNYEERKVLRKLLSDIRYFFMS
tara:strand:+ start:90 stop:1571 length:1482 start_codon:yes stop_codon:yes gene_type:complete